MLKHSPSEHRPAAGENVLPEDPWLRQIISDDSKALAAWDLIIRTGVEPRVLERRLLELRSREVPTAGFRRRSRRENERSVKRLKRAAQDILRFAVELSDVLSTPSSPPNSRLGELLSRVAPGAQPLMLSEWLSYFVSTVKQGLSRRERSKERARFPDRVHVVGAEVVHLCVVASSFAGLDAERAIRSMLKLPGPAVMRIKLKKQPGSVRYLYEHVADLLNAVLAEGLKRNVEARSLRRAYDSLHPAPLAPRKFKHKARKKITGHKIA